MTEPTRPKPLQPEHTTDRADRAGPTTVYHSEAFQPSQPPPASYAQGVDSVGAVRERAGRGRLVMAERVIEKIASQAAGEIALAGGRSGGLLGLRQHTDFAARPKVDVELAGATANLKVEVGVVYPAPIRQATDDIRLHLIERVGSLTGVTVLRVDIEVAWLSPDTGHERGIQ